MSRNGSLVTAEPTDRRSDRKRRKTDDTWIYFHGVIQPPPRRISIGKSSQPRGERLKQHLNSRLGIDVDIIELCELKGKPADEKNLHKYFDGFRFNGAAEVFLADETLTDYIRWLRDQEYVVLPEHTDEQREQVDTVASSLWMPNETRRKPAHPEPELPGFESFGPFNMPPRELTGDDFYTDEIILEHARVAMGGIDLDPASHAVANTKVMAKRFYSVKDDGLSREWHGRVWLNPPFGVWGKWIPKVILEVATGRAKELCLLVACRTLTAQYFATAIERCSAFCVLFGRYPFWGPDATSPDDGHCILYFGPNVESFRKSFSEIGTVFVPARCGTP